MGGGNAQKSKTARDRKMKENAKKGQGSQLASNAAACNIVCQVCRQSFLLSASDAMLREHALNKHPKSTPTACFPDKAL